MRQDIFVTYNISQDYSHESYRPIILPAFILKI